MSARSKDETRKEAAMCDDIVRDKSGHALECPRDHSPDIDCPVITEQRLLAHDDDWGDDGNHETA